MCRTNVDQVVVDRILAGIKTPCNSDERAEVYRRWLSTGSTWQDLEKLTGWNVARERKWA